MKKCVLPKAGEGPDEKTLNRGYLLLTAIGERE